MADDVSGFVYHENPRVLVHDPRGHLARRDHAHGTGRPRAARPRTRAAGEIIVGFGRNRGWGGRVAGGFRLAHDDFFPSRNWPRTFALIRAANGLPTLEPRKVY